MNNEEDDALLVAFIDRQLDEHARSALEARLAVDAALRERLARLREGGRPFAPAFEALLDEAPVERLKAALAALDDKGRRQAPARRPWGIAAKCAAVAAAIVLFCAGVVFGRYGLGDNFRQEDWRQAVVEYVSLYTSDTFAAQPTPRADALAAIGAKIGLDLTPDRVALANLQLKGAQILTYDGAPLGQLGYLDPTSGPVLFCIIRDGEPDAAIQTDAREDFAIASWAHGGRGYMLVGRLPVSRIASLADTLGPRF